MGLLEEERVLANAQSTSKLAGNGRGPKKRTYFMPASAAPTLNERPAHSKNPDTKEDSERHELTTTNLQQHTSSSRLTRTTHRYR